jgi:hypothetical protein
MSICDSFTIRTINLDECIGSSLLTLNNNFLNLKNQICANNTESLTLNTNYTNLTSNVTTLSSLKDGYAKAWVAFNGNGTGEREIFSSHNVASVSGISTGQYRIDFITPSPFANINYALIGTCQQTTDYAWVQPLSGGFQDDHVLINIQNSSGNLENSNYVSILIYA